MNARPVTADLLIAITGASFVGAAVGAVTAGLLFGLALPPFDAFLAIAVAFVGFLIGVPLALLHAALLGLPLYLAVRRWWGRPGRVGAGLFGLAIGVLPLAILLGLLPDRTGGATALDQSGPALAALALAGTAAGLTFRRLLRDEGEAGAAG
jgi:hypothetical protein